MIETFIKYLALFIASSGIVTAIVIYFGKKIFQQILNRDLENFKADLVTQNQINKLKHDKDLESYKSSLNLIGTRQSLLYTKRSEIIIELYQKLVIMHNSMLDLTAVFRLTHGKDTETLEKEELERIKETATNGNDFLSFYQKNKIYFNKDTCLIIQEIQEILKKSHSDYSFRHFWGIPPSEMTYKKASDANEKVQVEIPNLLTTLEDDFRRSIGVAN